MQRYFALARSFAPVYISPPVLPISRGERERERAARCSAAPSWGRRGRASVRSRCVTSSRRVTPSSTHMTRCTYIRLFLVVIAIVRGCTFYTLFLLCVYLWTRDQCTNARRWCVVRDRMRREKRALALERAAQHRGKRRVPRGKGDSDRTARNRRAVRIRAYVGI